MQISQCRCLFEFDFPFSAFSFSIVFVLLFRCSATTSFFFWRGEWEKAKREKEEEEAEEEDGGRRREENLLRKQQVITSHAVAVLWAAFLLLLLLLLLLHSSCNDRRRRSFNHYIPYDSGAALKNKTKNRNYTHSNAIRFNWRLTSSDAKSDAATNSIVVESSRVECIVTRVNPQLTPAAVTILGSRAIQRKTINHKRNGNVMNNNWYRPPTHTL